MADISYFFASLKTTCLRSFALYFLYSILRSTPFLFLRVQYTSPVDLFLSWISDFCDIKVCDMSEHYSLNMEKPQVLVAVVCNLVQKTYSNEKYQYTEYIECVRLISGNFHTKVLR